METTLNTLKNLYAQEQGYEDWEQYFMNHFVISQFSRTGTLSVFENVMDEICIRAQKAALEKAAENVTLISEHLLDNVKSFPKCVITNGINYSVYSESITNPENLIR